MSLPALAPTKQLRDGSHVGSVGLDGQVIQVEPAKQLLALGALARDARGVRLAHRAAAGVDVDELAGLEILGRDHADVRQLLFARIEDLQRDQIVARRRDAQRAARSRWR